MNKKIVGYRLIKVFPGSPLLGHIEMMGDHGENRHLHMWSEYWEPIYEEIKILNIGNLITRSRGFRSDYTTREVRELMITCCNETLKLVEEELIMHNNVEQLIERVKSKII